MQHTYLGTLMMSPLRALPLPAAAVPAVPVVVQTEAQLHKLPPPPASDPSFELFGRLRDLACAVAQAVEGSDSADFFRAADRSYTTFRQTVLTARPSVRLFGDKTAAASAGSDSNSSSHAWKEEDPEFWLEGPVQEEVEEGWGAPASREPEGLITLDKTRQLAARYRALELPSFVPYRVLEELVQGLKGRWDAAAAGCLHAVSEELQQLTDRLVEEHFGQFARACKEIRWGQLPQGLIAGILSLVKPAFCLLPRGCA